MPPVKPAGTVSGKWSRVTQTRSEDFQEGIQNPGKDWETETAAAEDRYADGVQQAITERRFGRGVRNAGTAKWQANAIEKGVRRWPEGVRAGQQNYEEGVRPYLEEIERVDLPPRYPTGDPRNLDRVAAITTALHAKKIRGV